MQKKFILTMALLAGLISSCKQETPPTSEINNDITALDGTVFKDIAGTKVFFKSNRDNFYDFPFPADHRRTADGHVDLTGFPTVSVLVYSYVDVIASNVEGFSNNAATYFHFDGALDPTSFPTPDQSQEAISTIRLINVDKSSPDYGKQVPVMIGFFDKAGSYNPENVLAVMPYPGFPLDASTTYAIVILRELGDISGHDLGSPALLQLALKQGEVEDVKMQEIVTAMQPLADYLAAKNDLKAEEIAAATVFTTQDPRAELLAIHKFINNRPAPKIQGYERISTNSDYYTVDAYYYGPNFQQGTKPYMQVGGGFAFDENGTPLLSTDHEFMKMRFSIPRDRSSMPEKGWPLVMIAHGTGGDYENYEWHGNLTRSTLLTKYGMAAVGISQPLHYERGCKDADTDTDIENDCQLDDTTLELAAFNVINPESGRTSFRQSAADTFQLVKMLIDNPPVIPADQTPDGQEVKFDTSDLLFHGHSHGGISGAIALGVEHRVRTSLHSGAGGLLSGTIAHSEMYNALAKTFMLLGDDEELTLLHPALMLVQTAADVTDPINYAPYYLKKAKPGEGHNILFTIGLYDGDTPYQTNNYLTAAAGLPVIGPERWKVEARDLQKMTPQAGPVSENCVSGSGEIYTCGSRQYGIEDDKNGCNYSSDSSLQDYCGHFVVFDKSDAAHMYTEFFYSYLNMEAPIIDPEWTEERSILK